MCNLNFSCSRAIVILKYIILIYFQNVALKEGTQAYGEWKNQSFPLKFKIHFFNVTNPYEVQNGARPILTEMGPYVYE